jgi:hypothetical protein
VGVTAGVYPVTTTTRAYIADDVAGAGSYADVQVGGDLRLSASGQATFTLLAGSAAIGTSSAGVGVSNTTLVHTDTVEAYVGADSRVRANGAIGLTVEADSSEELLTVVATGAGGSTAGVGASVPVQVMIETTRASIRDGARINQDAAVPGLPAASSTQGVSVRAADRTQLLGVGGAVAAGGTAGVGAGADVLALNKNTTAFIGGATVDAEGDVKVEVQSIEELAAAALAVGVGGTAGVSLSAGILVVNVGTRAFIGDDTATDASSLSAGVADVHARGNVIIDADVKTEVDNVAGSLGIGGTAGVGVAVPITVLNKTTESYIGRHALVTGDGTASSVASLGRFGPAAYNTDTGSSEFGGLDSDGGYAGQLEVAPPDTTGTSNLSPESSSDSVGGDQVTKDRSVERTTGSVRGVVVTATNRDSVETFGIAGGGGTVGVGVTGTVSVNNATTSAFVASGAEVNADQSGADLGQNVLLSSADDYQHMTVVASVAGGYVGASVNAGVTVANRNTFAFVDDDASIEAAADVQVSADAVAQALTFNFAAAGGFVGVALPVGVLVINSTTEAYIGDDATSLAGGAVVDAGGSVRVFANATTDTFAIVGGVAGGAVGVTGSVGVLALNKDTSASIGNYATVDADGVGAGFGAVSNGTVDDDTGAFGRETRRGVIVQAESREDVFVIGASAGAGAVGVSAAVTVQSFDSDTTASIGNSARINQTDGNVAGSAGQSVTVSALNEAESFRSSRAASVPAPSAPVAPSTWASCATTRPPPSGRTRWCRRARTSTSMRWPTVTWSRWPSPALPGRSGWRVRSPSGAWATLSTRVMPWSSATTRAMSRGSRRRRPTTRRQ